MDVSIIIVNWNTRDILRDCLESIYKQTEQVDYDVIVVDNASADGSVEMIQNTFHEVQIVVNNENLGYAAAVNQGIRASRGRYCLIINSDIIICERAIEKSIVYMDNHPQVGVMGCQVWQTENKIQKTCFCFPDVINVVLSAVGLANIFKNNKIFGRERMLWWDRDTEQEVDVITGMFMMVRHEAIDQVGLMDERFFMYYEETDWCRRLHQEGWICMFWPGAKVIHVHGGGQSAQMASLRMFLQMQRSQWLYFRKHKTRLKCTLIRYILIWAFLFRSIIWSIFIPFFWLVKKDITEACYKRKRAWIAFVFFCTNYVTNKT